MKINLKTLASFEAQWQQQGSHGTVGFVMDAISSFFFDDEIDPVQLKPIFDSLEELKIVSDIEEDFEETEEED